MPKIEILSGKREGESVDLPDEGIDIGNRKTAKLSIRDPWISWNHAKIVPEAGGFVIEDLGSSNGTWINGKKVTRQAIVAGEEIFLGKTKIRYVEGQAGAPVERVADAGGTTKLSRSSTIGVAMPALEAEGGGARVAELERENLELRKMKEALERFLDVSPEERAALLAGAPAAAPPPAAPPPAAADDGVAEKKRQEAMAKVIELEGKLAAAESRAVDAENRIKGSADQAKKDLARARDKFEEELGLARAGKAEAEAARDAAEAKAAAAARKAETAAADAVARAEKLEKDLESAKKSAIDAEARAQKLERDLDKARALKQSASAGPSKEDLERVRGELEAAQAERDSWKAKHDGIREEIDNISREQIEIEDQLRARIAELEGKK